jgi:hypothetical protein
LSGIGERSEKKGDLRCENLSVKDKKEKVVVKNEERVWAALICHLRPKSAEADIPRKCGMIRDNFGAI